MLATLVAYLDVPPEFCAATALTTLQGEHSLSCFFMRRLELIIPYKFHAKAPRRKGAEHLIRIQLTSFAS